jgi:hypothetical protein
MTTIGHLLDPEHAPTPFTAEQIREATPDGWTVETLTHRDGGIERDVTVFRDPDDHEVTLESARLEGGELHSTGSHRVTWLDLQRHASFPDAITTITPVTLDTPMGPLECLRYGVVGEGSAATFWFALAHPGMPVRYEAGPADAREVTEVVEYRRG